MERARCKTYGASEQEAHPGAITAAEGEERKASKEKKATQARCRTARPSSRVCMYVGTYVCMDECMYPSKMPDRAP